jgi:hypothetical protein
MNRIFVVNEHPIERAVRVLFGLGIVSLAFIGPKSSWAYLGLVPVVTGLSGMCPLYSVLGFSTCGVSSRKSA